MNPRPAIGHHQARVLIVDDERHNRQLLEVMLAPEGFVLLTAASGEEALAIVAQQPPDLILLDIMMPGMDGYQVAAKIKGDPATENIPVIMVTALDDRNARMLGLSAGAEEFLSRPVDRAELCVRVRNLLRLKAYGDDYDKYSQMLESVVASRSADLAERTKQAAVLTEQAALLDLAQDAIVVRDMHGRISFWSRGAEVLYGWPSQGALGQNEYELLKTEYSEPTEHIDATLLRQGQWEGEATQYRRDGTRVIVASRWALQRDADGAPIRILTINTDVTDRKQTDDRLLSLTERLSISTAVAKVGVWEWDLASNTVTWDATMFDIYGVPPVVPMPYDRWSAAVCPEDLPAVEAALRRVIDEQGQGSSEYRIIRPDGSRRFVSAVERAVLDERARVSRVIGVNIDVTERKEMEAALEQSREDQVRLYAELEARLHELETAQEQVLRAGKLAAVGQLATGVAHEINNPLATIMGQTEMLKRRLTDPALIERVAKIADSALRAAQSVRKLQTFIKPGLDEVGPLDVPAIIRIVVAQRDSALRLNNVTLVQDIPQAVPAVLGNQGRLELVILNLWLNAEQAVAGTASPRITVAVQVHDRLVRVTIADTGNGVPAEILPRVFEPFFTTKAPNQHSGLGLSIASSIVQSHGGTLTVESTPGGGTTFVLDLPSLSETPAETSHTEPTAPSLRPGHVLVIEDSPDVAGMLRDMLQDLGLEVTVSADAEEAWIVLARKGSDLDAVTLDLRLPGLSGTALYERILVEVPDLADRVLFITGDRSDLELERFVERSGRPTLHKPFSLQTLVAALSPILSTAERR
jgi:PAS domain S-box-containing protein